MLGSLRKHEDIESLFPEDEQMRGQPGDIKLSDLPYLVRPIIERIHEVRPAVVIAGDRGARLLAFTALKSWGLRYPGERFPTIDGRIHMARVTSRSAPESEVTKAIHFTLDKAGLNRSLTKGQEDGSAPKVIYMDDWAVYGGTAELFIDSASRAGIPARSITYATMCGHRMKSVKPADHFIADPERNPRWSVWDEPYGDVEDSIVGVRYRSGNPTVPVAAPNRYATEARQEIGNHLANYYRHFVEYSATRVAQE